MSAYDATYFSLLFGQHCPQTMRTVHSQYMIPDSLSDLSSVCLFYLPFAQASAVLFIQFVSGLSWLAEAAGRISQWGIYGQNGCNSWRIPSWMVI